MSRYSKNKYKKYRHFSYQSNKRPESLKEVFYSTGIELQLKESTLRKYWYWTRKLILNCKPVLHPSQMSDNYVISFIDTLISGKLSKTTVTQAIDSMRFLYEHVIRNRTALVKELLRIRKNYSKNIPLKTKKSFWQFIFNK